MNKFYFELNDACTVALLATIIRSRQPLSLRGLVMKMFVCRTDEIIFAERDRFDGVVGESRSVVNAS